MKVITHIYAIHTQLLLFSAASVEVFLLLLLGLLKLSPLLFTRFKIVFDY